MRLEFPVLKLARMNKKSKVDDLDYESHENNLDPKKKKTAPTPRNLLEKKKRNRSMTETDINS